MSEIIIDMPACEGCCGDIGNVCDLTCQDKEGTYVLCGFPEFVSPSTPPKKYRTCTFGGSVHGDAFSGTTCGTPSGNFDETLSGAVKLSAGDCSQTEAGTETLVINGGAPVDFTLNDPFIWTTDTCDALTSTQTSQAFAGTETCCITGASSSQIHTGTRTQDLSDEDTDDDAVARANAAIPDWSGSDCADDPAFITQRGSGDFDETYRSVQVQGTAGAFPNPPLIIGHDYEVLIPYERRLLGSSDPWVYTGIMDSVSIHATSTTETTPWLDVPNVANYETRPKSCRVIDVT